MLNWINKKKNKKGFTLVELVVVIAILGVLAAIAVPKLTNTLTNSKDKADLATARVIESAVQMFQANSPGNALPVVGDFKSTGDMKDYLSAKDLTDSGVKAPLNTANAFYYNDTTGAVVVNVSTTVPDGFTKISN